MSNTYAPILISVYNRLDHLKQCIASLRLNAPSAESDLYVVSDAAFAPQDESKIKEVRGYLEQVTGFRQVVAINRDDNLGSYLSIKQAITDVVERHGRIIFLEDDNVVAPNFLQFVNDGLDFYAADTSVFSVSGYNYPIKMPVTYSHDVYAWQGFSAWGVGTWYDRWQAVDWSYPDTIDLQWGKPLRRDLDRIGEHLARQMLLDITHGRQIVDVVISHYLCRQRKYSVFPAISKVRNTGHDGTGEHGHVTDVYVQQVLDTGEPYRLVAGLKPDTRINHVLRQHFALSLRTKLAIMIGSRLSPDQKQWVKRHILRRST